MKDLASPGLFLVPVGELECWVKTIPGGDKNRWLASVFNDGHYKNPIGALTDFCTAIASYLSTSGTDELFA